MPHSLILGMSESGKTTLGRALATEYKRAGVAVIVLDPLRDPRWQADFLTTDAKEFRRVFWQSRSCMAFIDEAGEAIGKYDATMQACVTRGRHWGHSVHVITQRGAQLSPTVRDQCRHLFLFCSSRQDGELLAREWNFNDLATCANLKQGEYFRASRFGGFERKSIAIGGYENASIDSPSGSGNRRDRRPDEASEKGNGASADASASASGGPSETG